MSIIDDLKKYDLVYDDGNPLISDTKYDKLYQKGKELFPDDPYFNTVGIPVKKGKVKVDLPYILGSLDKRKIPTIEKWLNKQNGPFIISEKLDGVSFYAEYNKGKLVFASTRGDGFIGNDITDKVRIVAPYVSYPGEIHVRGELMLIGDAYKKLGFVNRRAGASGIINRDNLKEVKFLTPCFYEVIWADNNFDELDEFEKYLLLSTHEFYFLPDIFVLDRDELSADILVELFQKCKEKATNYTIDGLVISPLKYTRENVEIPKNKISFKVNEDAVKARVNKVVWQVGRTGRVIPVVEIDTIEIDGINVSRATGFNAKYILDNKITKGTKITICRSGSVIPYIVEVL